MFSWRNKKDISMFQLKKMLYIGLDKSGYQVSTKHETSKKNINTFGLKKVP